MSHYEDERIKLDVKTYTKEDFPVSRGKKIIEQQETIISLLRENVAVDREILAKLKEYVSIVYRS